MSSVYCIACHSPGAIDEDSLCFHCRRVPRSQTPERPNDLQVLFLVILWAGIAAAVAVVANTIAK